jgi:hypothetical protein
MLVTAKGRWGFWKNFNRLCLDSQYAGWAVDFMSDTLYEGRRFRTLSILDKGVRESLAIEVDTP